MIILVLEFVIHIFIYLISFPSYHNLDIWQWAIYMVSNYFDKFIETGANESTCPSNCHPDSSEHFVGNGKSSKTFLKLNQPSSAPELSIWIGIITCTPTYARNRGTVSTPSFPLACSQLLAVFCGFPCSVLGGCPDFHLPTTMLV